MFNTTVRDVTAYIDENGVLIGEFQDVESGASEVRKGMVEAIAACKLQGATLVVKEMSRISKYCRKDVVTTINVFKKMRLEEPLEVANVEIEEEPLIIKLFGGGEYNKAEEDELKSILKDMSEPERLSTYVILDSVVSGAKGKKTKILKNM